MKNPTDSYGLPPTIPLSEVLLSPDDASLALARNAMFRGLFALLNRGEISHESYRTWCDRTWSCTSETEVDTLAESLRLELNDSRKDV